jgi:hypothetical protein
VTCRQIAWVRATAVVKRWSGQPRRPLFHLQSSASDSATLPSDSADLRISQTRDSFSDSVPSGDNAP